MCGAPVELQHGSMRRCDGPLHYAAFSALARAGIFNATCWCRNVLPCMIFVFGQSRTCGLCLCHHPPSFLCGGQKSMNGGSPPLLWRSFSCTQFCYHFGACAPSLFPLLFAVGRPFPSAYAPLFAYCARLRFCLCHQRKGICYEQTCSRRRKKKKRRGVFVHLPGDIEFDRRSCFLAALPFVTFVSAGSRLCLRRDGGGGDHAGEHWQCHHRTDAFLLTLQQPPLPRV